jgi:uncharacterized protein
MEREPPAAGSGIEMRPAHFPGRAPVDAYGNGGFRFAGMSHRGSILMLPSGIHAWNVTSAADLRPEAFRTVLAEADSVELLLIGAGPEPVVLDPQLRALFRENGIFADCMPTGAAARTFNVLLAEKRAVAAALIAV